MAMVVAWQMLNKVTYSADARFNKHVLVIAPGLTVRNRLQVLVPDSEGNYYDEFNIVPHGLFDKLRQGKVVIHNWHYLTWDTEEQIARRRGVDKRGAKSDEAYVRDVLGDMASVRDLIVINDEVSSSSSTLASCRLAVSNPSGNPSDTVRSDVLL